MALIVKFAMYRQPDNATDAIIDTAVEAWLATLTIVHVYGWTVVHKSGFWEYTIIYDEA